MNENYIVQAHGDFRMGAEQMRRLIVECIKLNNEEILQYFAEKLFGPALLTAKEAQERLKISRSTLLRWEKGGVITPVRVGRTKRYQQSEIINLKNTRR